MSWPIRMVEPPPKPDDRRVGDAWFAPGYETGCCPFYHERNSFRPPLYVTLPCSHDPNGQPFLVDAFTYSDGKNGADGWKVYGVPPAITVEPSINMVGIYHGYIRDGVITDDCEGRTFTVAPR